MRHVLVSALALVLASCAVACSSKGSRPSPLAHSAAPPASGSAFDAGSPDAAATSPASNADAGGSDARGDDGRLCVILSNAGPSIREKRIADRPPRATGGVISPGIYELVQYNTYTGAGGATGQTARTFAETIRFDGFDFEDVVQSGNGKDALLSNPMAHSGNYSADESTLSMTVTCPYQSSESYELSTLGSEIHIVSDNTERVFRMQ